MQCGRQGQQAASLLTRLTILTMARLILRADRRARAQRADSVGRVGAFVRGSLEEVVLQGIVRCDPRLRVVVQHSQDEVLKLKIVRHAVAGLAVPPAARPARLDAEYVVQLARAGRFVFALVLRLPQHVATVRRELLEEFACFVRLVEDVLRRHTEHLHDPVDLVGLVRAGKQWLTGVHLDQDAPERPHVDC